MRIYNAFYRLKCKRHLPIHMWLHHIPNIIISNDSQNIEGEIKSFERRKKKTFTEIKISY